MTEKPDAGAAGGRLAVILKACPKCLGDLIRQGDPLGPDYYGCLQCGAEIEGEPRRPEPAAS